MGIARYINPRAIPPLIIFTALSSLAFNNSLLVSSRREEERTIHLIHSLLADVVELRRLQLQTLTSTRGIANDKATQEGWKRRERELGARLAGIYPLPYQLDTASSSSSSSSSTSSSERGQTAKPRVEGVEKFGLSPPSSRSPLPSPAGGHVSGTGEEEITWTRILFGNREEGETKRRLQDVVEGIRESFTLASLTGSSRGGAPGKRRRDETEEERRQRELEEREEERRLLDEWSKAVSEDGRGTEGR